MTTPSPATRGAALLPRALRVGSRVALVAPAGPVDPARLAAAVERCRTEGLEPVVFPSAGGRYRYMAGTDEERLRDLQAAFDDRSIDAVWAIRGGYGTLRIVDRLKLDRLRQDPIPFIGFSDNTSIHARISALGIVSFHGPHPGGDFPPETAEMFRRVLFHAEAPGRLPTRRGDPAPRTLVPGTVEAPLAGGNLSLLAALCGTRHAVAARGCILFLEEIAEPTYRVDRLLVQIRAAGVTDGVVGLAFGRFTDGPDEERFPVSETLADFAEELGVPAVADLPFGHVEHNCTLPVGGRALLDGETATLALTGSTVRAV